jgi:hypothetical protein
MLFIEPSLSPIPERYVFVSSEQDTLLTAVNDFIFVRSLDDDESDRSITQNRALSFNDRLAMETDDCDAENEAISPRKRSREPPSGGTGRGVASFYCIARFLSRQWR